MGSQPPFDVARLDDLMLAAGLDVLIVSSKHNVRYLLGGHANLFSLTHGCARRRPLPAGPGLRATPG